MDYLQSIQESRDSDEKFKKIMDFLDKLHKEHPTHSFTKIIEEFASSDGSIGSDDYAIIRMEEQLKKDGIIQDMQEM